MNTSSSSQAGRRARGRRRRPRRRSQTGGANLRSGDQRNENHACEEELQSRPKMAHPGATPDGRERASFRLDAGKEQRARDQERSSRARRASPDRGGLAARREERCLRHRSRSRTESSGSLGAERGHPRGGEPAPAGVPRAANRWPHRPQRPSPRGGQRSQRS